jgi:hypothetical protein
MHQSVLAHPKMLLLVASRAPELLETLVELQNLKVVLQRTRVELSALLVVMCVRIPVAMVLVALKCKARAFLVPQVMERVPLEVR